MKKCEIKGICRMLTSPDEGTVNLALQFIENFMESNPSTYDAKDFMLVFDKHYKYINVFINIMKYRQNGSNPLTTERRANVVRYNSELGRNLIKIADTVTHRKLKLSNLNISLFRPVIDRNL